jgi:hypothetical protein
MKIATRSRLRLATTGLLLVAVAGVQLADVTSSYASTVTKPKLATVADGRFTSMVVLDGGVITIRPAPAGTTTVRGLGAATAKIWASSQLSGFARQTLGYGYVTIKGTPKGETPVNHVLGWVGFANGNSSGACTKNKAKKLGSNGEAAVFLGDAAGSSAIAYVPSACGFPDRAGYTVPNEIVSVPWVQVGTADAHGFVTFHTTSAQCGAVEGSTRDSGPGKLTVLLYTESPDWTITACSATILSLGMPLAKTATKANALRLLHGATGPVRQVVAPVS